MTNHELAAAIVAAEMCLHNTRRFDFTARRLWRDHLALLMDEQLARAAAPSPSDYGHALGAIQGPAMTRDLGDYMDAAAAGIDLDKELDNIDPRALKPRCTHGFRMPTREDPGEDCALCAGKGNGHGPPDTREPLKLSDIPGYIGNTEIPP
jgi:hypothetical protein